MPKSAMYLHFPFCRHKCTYCDFYSVISLTNEPAFFEALFREIEIQSMTPFVAEREFSTLYLGGGTPSLISTKYLDPLIRRLKDAFKFDSEAEFSFEANPGAILKDRLQAFRQVGFNRLTIGVQSFNDSELRFLTRIHSAADAKQAVHLARESGFENIGIDLIFGIPGQTATSWRTSLDAAIGSRAEHISLYGLTYETNTPLWRLEQARKVKKCDESLERDMLLLGIEVLENAGYEQYEISNFSLPGRRSRHNSAYWLGAPYLGLGPSAHSYDGLKRWWNVDDIHTYSKMLKKDQLPIAGSEKLDLTIKLHELILLGLRRVEGVDLASMQRITGTTVDKHIQQISQAMGAPDNVDSFAKSKRGALLTITSGSLCLTREGLLLYDSVCGELFKVIK